MKIQYIVLFFLTAFSTSLHAETVAIIGTGNLGSALGPAFATQGHTIIYGSRHPDSDKAQALVAATSQEASVTTPREAVHDASIVVLAVPGLLVEEITLGLGDLTGKIIIDPTNPLLGDWDTELSLGGETSNAQIIQNAAPNAFVVKAFNTLNWRQMIEPGGDITIMLAGDNEGAKEWVAELIIGMGLHPIDLGSAKHARWVEGMALLWINNRISSRPGFDFHLRRIE
jgi:predicted dinucleotide-binding enzyme